MTAFGGKMTRKSDVQLRAREALRDHGLIGGPVDPVRLAGALGVKVYNAKFGAKGIHGLLAIRSGRPSIYVEASDAPARKRFTIAHELGHYLLHFGDQDIEHIDEADDFRSVADLDEGWSPERRREWEANTFAAALLMDEESVREHWPRVGSVDGMAALYQVSKQAMVFRLAELGLID